MNRLANISGEVDSRRTSTSWKDDELVILPTLRSCHDADVAWFVVISSTRANNSWDIHVVCSETKSVESKSCVALKNLINLFLPVPGSKQFTHFGSITVLHWCLWTALIAIPKLKTATSWWRRSRPALFSGQLDYRDQNFQWSTRDGLAGLLILGDSEPHVGNDICFYIFYWSWAVTHHCSCSTCNRLRKLQVCKFSWQFTTRKTSSAT